MKRSVTFVKNAQYVRARFSRLVGLQSRSRIAGEVVSSADWTDRTAPSRATTVDLRGETITARAGSLRRLMRRRCRNATSAEAPNTRISGFTVLILTLSARERNQGDPRPGSELAVTGRDHGKRVGQQQRGDDVRSLRSRRVRERVGGVALEP